MDELTPWKVRCKAHNRAGDQCGKYAMVGQEVCANHGGKSPQALARARERIAELVHPALDRLTALLGSDDERVALQAVRLVLDKAVDEMGDPLGAPIPSAEQVAAWIAELEHEANRG